MARTVAEMVSAIEVRAGLPANRDRFLTSDLIPLMKQELQETVVPFMYSLVEEFFVVSKTEDMLDDTGNPRFPELLVPVPRRSYARGIRDIQFINTGSVRTNIPEISPEDIDIFLMPSLANFTTPAGFFFQNDSIKLIGTESTINGSIIFTFYLKVPTVTSDTTRQVPITNIAWNSTTNVAEFTVTSTGAAAEFLSGTGLFDLYRVSAGSYNKIDLVCVVTGSGSTRTFTTDSLNENETVNLISSQEGGFPVATPYTSDFILVPQDVNPYIPIPDELDNFLISAVCGRILESLGDVEGLAVNNGVLKRIQDNMAKIYGDRAVGESKKAVNRRGVYNFMRRRFLKGRI